MKASNPASTGHFVNPVAGEPGKYVVGFYVDFEGKRLRKIRIVTKAGAERFAMTWGLELPEGGN